MAVGAQVPRGGCSPRRVLELRKSRRRGLSVVAEARQAFEQAQKWGCTVRAGNGAVVSGGVLWGQDGLVVVPKVAVTLTPRGDGGRGKRVFLVEGMGMTQKPVIASFIGYDGRRGIAVLQMEDLFESVGSGNMVIAGKDVCVVGQKVYGSVLAEEGVVGISEGVLGKVDQSIAMENGSILRNGFTTDAKSINLAGTPVFDSVGRLVGLSSADVSQGGLSFLVPAELIFDSVSKILQSTR